mmetsp:Transcript_71879/g.83540  ORF Transcript_71879/g.83540 Transcript_71879/m.83540 type:complete len:965 (+) Transcript_71879:49-2943(+)
MVKRNGPTRGLGKAPKKSLSKKQVRLQKKGELDLSNPHIPAELDEDIDDDLAFNSEDEEKYGAFFASKAEDGSKSKKKLKKKQASASSAVADSFDRLHAVKEDADGEAEMGFSDDSRDEIDLSEMLDSKEDKRAARTNRRSKREGRRSAPDSKLTKEEESILGPIEGLDTSNEALSAKQRKAAGLHELLQGAPETAAVHRLQEALKSRKNLLAEDVDDLTKERMTRAHTRDGLKSNLKKYSTVLKLQKETPHLKFPLHADDANPVPGTIGSLAAALSKNAAAEQRSASDKKGTPATESMASKMDTILRASGLGSIRAAEKSKDDAQKEHIAFDDGEPGEDGEDVDGNSGGMNQRIQVGYMAKLKSMLSYEIAKRKRLNKIKSKTYRRILRKEKERDQERRQKALELLNPEAARARLREKMEKLRAEERATQKHKNTSKWVKHAKKFSKFDSDTKDAIDEQHVLRQRLMAKMDEEADHEIAQVADDMSESSEEEMRVDELLVGKKDAKSILWQQEGEDDDDGQPMSAVQKSRKELMKMGFMQRGKERSEAELNHDLENLQKDIERYRNGEDLLHVPSGMLSKGQKKARAALEDEDEDLAEAEAAEDDAKELEGLNVQSKKKPAKKSSVDATASSVQTKGLGRKVVTESAAHKAQDVVLKKRGGISIASHADDGNVAEGVSTNGWNDDEELEETEWHEGDEEKKNPETLRTSHDELADDVDEFAGAREGRKKASKVSTTRVVIPVISSVSVEESSGTSRKRVREEAAVDVAVEQGATAEPSATAEDEAEGIQEYLITRAFAMDDVDDDFLKAKEAQVEAMMKPEDRNASLPGWGEWGGEDERLNQRHRDRVEAKALERKIAKTALMKARADAQLDNVIINHDVDLVPDRQTLHMVPRPFSNPTEFARSMRQPMGPEWNTPMSFKEGTQPRITTTQGVVIEPLDLTTQRKKAKTVRRKLAAKKSRGD